MRVLVSLALVQAIASIACQSESPRNRTPLKVERKAQVESLSSTELFKKHAYESFLRDLAKSNDPARREAAVVLRSGHDETISRAQYSAVSNVLAEIGVFMPLGSKEPSDERYLDLPLRVKFLCEFDKVLNGSPIPGSQGVHITPGEAGVVAEAVAAARFAYLRGGSLTGRPGPYDEMFRVMDRHGIHQQHPRRGAVQRAISFLETLLSHVLPPSADSAEWQMLRDLTSGLAQFENDRGLYIGARNRLGRSLINRYVAVDRKRWPGLMPPPLWYFKDFEWEQFDITWNGTGQIGGQEEEERAKDGAGHGAGAV